MRLHMSAHRLPGDPCVILVEDAAAPETVEAGWMAGLGRVQSGHGLSYASRLDRTRERGPCGPGYEPEFWVCEYDLACPGRMWLCGTSKGACVAMHFTMPAVARSLPVFSIWWGEDVVLSSAAAEAHLLSRERILHTPPLRLGTVKRERALRVVSLQRYLRCT